MHAPRSIALIAMLVCLAVPGCSGKGGSPTAPSTGNHDPTISVNTNRSKLLPNLTAAITVSASDQDGDQLTYAYSATGGTVSSSGPTATVATFTAGSTPGPASVTATASDGNGGTASGTASMYIQNPNPPITFSGAGSLACMRLRISSSEACTLTSITVWVRNNSYVGEVLDVTLPASMTSNDVLQVGPASGSCWDMTSCQVMWARVRGTRPEPDGGEFTANYYYHI
jgi:hypothetical protein